MEIIPTEVDKYRRFEDSLNDNIRLIVTSHHFTDFSLLVASSLDEERVRDNEQSRRDRQHKRGLRQGQFSAPVIGSKKPKGSQSQTQGQRGQSGVSVASSPSIVTRESIPVPECTHCGRRYRGIVDY